MITRREVDEFVLQVMQGAFLALRESNRADESRTVLCELQQAMQLLPTPITSATPLSALQAFLQYGRNEFRRSGWVPNEPPMPALWRGLEALTEGELQLVSAGAGLIGFACAQEVERRRIERRDKQLQFEREEIPAAHERRHNKRGAATLSRETDE